MLPTKTELKSIQNNAKPRMLPDALEYSVNRGKGGLWAAERSLRQAFIQNAHQPWETVGTVRNWIMLQNNPLRICDRVAVLILDWMTCFDIDDDNRAIAAQISDSIEDWRREILENPT
jgi:hypothetical protein